MIQTIALYVAGLAVFLAGVAYGLGRGREHGRVEALAEVSTVLEDEALRAALHGKDETCGLLFHLARRVRALGPVAESEEQPEPTAIEVIH